MVNAKVKIFNCNYSVDLDLEMNNFLQTIDVRQIIKTEFSAAGGGQGGYRYTTLIYYIELDDVRDIKIDSILKNPL